MTGIILVLRLTDRKQRGYRPASRSRWLSDPRPSASSSWCCWRCWPGRGRGWSAAPCARGQCRGGWGRRSRRRPRRGRRGGSRWWCRRWNVSPASEGRVVSCIIEQISADWRRINKNVIGANHQRLGLIAPFYCIRICIYHWKHECLSVPGTFRVTRWSINIIQIRAKVLLSLVKVWIDSFTISKPASEKFPSAPESKSWSWGFNFLMLMA